MKDLTPRQLEVLNFISAYIKAHNYPPAIREIGDHFEISVKGAHDHVNALKRKGYIRADKRPRTMELLHADTLRKETVEVPIVGTVAAGTPILAEENWEGTVSLPRTLFKEGAVYFALRVQGDSMNLAGIMDGDLAVIEQRSTADDGEIVVAGIEEGMTVKRFFREKNRYRLQPESDNKDHKPRFTQDVQILGRLAHVVRSY
ncbi:MAG: transcriptional repressor LexA [Spirochaetaceae bacterium]|jgi:repressor LexA|nr:transcriptional repressor LexA [Spirochaetaceae bacterium]